MTSYDDGVKKTEELADQGLEPGGPENEAGSDLNRGPEILGRIDRGITLDTRAFSPLDLPVNQQGRFVPAPDCVDSTIKTPLDHLTFDLREGNGTIDFNFRRANPTGESSGESLQESPDGNGKITAKVEGLTLAQLDTVILVSESGRVDNIFHHLGDLKTQGVVAEIRVQGLSVSALVKGDGV